MCSQTFGCETPKTEHNARGIFQEKTCKSYKQLLSSASFILLGMISSLSFKEEQVRTKIRNLGDRDPNWSNAPTKMEVHRGSLLKVE